jgi:hypothetical protein
LSDCSGADAPLVIRLTAEGLNRLTVLRKSARYFVDNAIDETVKAVMNERRVTIERIASGNRLDTDPVVVAKVANDVGAGGVDGRIESWKA